MSVMKRLTAKARLARCWGEEPSIELIKQIEEEQQKSRPSKELLDSLAELRRAWRAAAASTKRDRHVLFLGSVYFAAAQSRRFSRQDDLANLARFFDITPTRRDIFQILLLAVCRNQIDRKVRWRWVACLRTVAKHRTPPQHGAAQIICLGGINQCAALSGAEARLD